MSSWRWNEMSLARMARPRIATSLWKRSNAELEGETNSGRIAALLAASLVPVSECLRVSIEAAKNPEAMRSQMVGITTRMLETLLDDVLAARRR